MRAKQFDAAFEAGEGITEHLDLSKAKRLNKEQKRINLDIPVWMVESLDNEAKRLGVTRQSVIKFWLSERLEQKV